MEDRERERGKRLREERRRKGVGGGSFAELWIVTIGDTQ